MVSKPVFHEAVSRLTISLEDSQHIGENPLSHADWLEAEAKRLREAVSIVGKDTWIVR